MRPLVKVLDLKALRENVAVLQAHAGGAQLIAVVKANAYGHGMAEVLPALSEVAQLAVASVDEALALRALGASQAVVLLEGVFSFEALAICARYDFIVMVHHLPQLVWLERWAQGARLGERLRVWVKVDSGMHRLGFAPQEVSQVAERLAGLSAVVCLGVATHFACADEVDLLPTHQQLAVMEGLTLPRGWARCYANSAALLRGVAVDCEWVRAGVALYGMSPFAGVGAQELGLQAVMHLQTQILAVHALEAGEGAGYGLGFVAPTAGWVAVIALGYGDGFSRGIVSGAVQVRIGGRCFAIVGRVAMDMCLVWLGEARFEVGEAVTVWGDGHAIEARALEAGTIVYTLTTSLMARVRTEVIDG